MVDVRGDVFRPPHGTTPAAVKSNKNQKWVVLWDSNLIFDRTQLSAVGVSLLCNYTMVVEYILEINLTKRKKIYEWFYSILMNLSKRNWCRIDKKQGLSSAVSQIMKKYFFFFFFFFFFVHNGYRTLLTVALMPIKQYTVFRCLLPLSAKYWFKPFYNTLFFTIHT